MTGCRDGRFELDVFRRELPGTGLTPCFVIYINAGVMEKRRARGRPPKMSEPSRLVAFRLPRSLVDRLDHYAAEATRFRGRMASRADAVRYLLERALASDELGAARQRRKRSSRRS